MLVGARVQAMFLQMGDLGSRGHGAHLWEFGENPRLLHCSTAAKKNNRGQIPITARRFPSAT
jgi:hypothetical protein